MTCEVTQWSKGLRGRVHYYWCVGAGGVASDYDLTEAGHSEVEVPLTQFLAMAGSAQVIVIVVAVVVGSRLGSQVQRTRAFQQPLQSSNPERASSLQRRDVTVLVAHSVQVGVSKPLTLISRHEF
ncbi:hypothetical protein H2248_010171 [Termitomyces sp. 'cryptogamus']|nr:hypothetical protein H2248_010171 [Termitomyces sp. 'cryptogamus']